MTTRTLRFRSRSMRSFYLIAGSFTVLLVGLAFCLFLMIVSAPAAQETMWR